MWKGRRRKVLIVQVERNESWRDAYGMMSEGFDPKLKGDQRPAFDSSGYPCCWRGRKGRKVRQDAAPVEMREERILTQNINAEGVLALHRVAC